MLRDRAWHGTDDLTCAQLVRFRALGDQIHLTSWRTVHFPPNPQRKRCCGDWGKAAFELMIMAEPVHGNSTP